MICINIDLSDRRTDFRCKIFCSSVLCLFHNDSDRSSFWSSMCHYCSLPQPMCIVPLLLVAKTDILFSPNQMPTLLRSISCSCNKQIIILHRYFKAKRHNSWKNLKYSHWRRRKCFYRLRGVFTIMEVVGFGNTVTPRQRNPADASYTTTWGRMSNFVETPPLPDSSLPFGRSRSIHDLFSNTIPSSLCSLSTPSFECSWLHQRRHGIESSQARGSSSPLPVIVPDKIFLLKTLKDGVCKKKHLTLLQPGEVIPGQRLNVGDVQEQRRRGAAGCNSQLNDCFLGEQPLDLLKYRKIAL